MNRKLIAITGVGYQSHAFDLLLLITRRKESVIERIALNIAEPHYRAIERKSRAVRNKTYRQKQMNSKF